MNEHITTYLDKYISLINPDYGVMITGSWGCGKTYFIKEFINKNNQKKIKYISLNGISEITSIISKCFFSGGALGNTLSKFGNILTETKVSIPFIQPLSLNDLFSSEDMKSFIKDTIIIFDDIERCKIDILELLGFISDLLDKNNLHILMICDENKFENHKDYFSRKEKIIGKTFELESNDQYILTQLIKEVSDEQIRLQINDKLETIVDIIKRANNYSKDNKECENLTNFRVVKHVLRHFCFVFEEVIQHFEKTEYKHMIFDYLFYNFLVINYLQHLNKISNDEIKELSERFNLFYDRTNFVSTLMAKFPEISNHLLLSAMTWINIFMNKYISSENLIAELQNNITPKLENWQELWHFFKKEDNDINKYYLLVKEDLEKGEIVDAIEILHVFAIFLVMSKEKFIDTPLANIIIEAKSYIDKIESNITNKSNMKEFSWENIKFINGTGLGFYGEGTDEVKEIFEYLKNVIDKKEIEYREDEYKKFLNMLNNEDAKYNEYMYSNFKGKDIFSGHDAFELFKRWSELNTEKFNDIGHDFDSKVIEEQIMCYSSQKDFWIEFLNLANEFLEKYTKTNTEKSKCLYLRKYFIPNVSKILGISS